MINRDFSLNKTCSNLLENLFYLEFCFSNTVKYNLSHVYFTESPLTGLQHTRLSFSIFYIYCSIFFHQNRSGFKLHFDKENLT